MTAALPDLLGELTSMAELSLVPATSASSGAESLDSSALGLAGRLIVPSSSLASSFAVTILKILTKAIPTTELLYLKL